MLNCRTWPRVKSALSLGVVLAALTASAGCFRAEPSEPPWLSIIPGAIGQPPKGDWLGYRGAICQGVSETTGLPVEFGEGLNERWRVALPGEGHSSPTVVGNRVFLTAQTTAQPPELLAVCFACDTGELVWQQSAGAPQGSTHRKNGFASATVASDGERIYATFGARGIFCYSVDGQQLWHVPLDNWDHEWGQASSPIICGDLVIQLADGTQGSQLLALHCHTGELVWSTPRLSAGSWTTPVLVHAAIAGGHRWEVAVNGTGSANGSTGFLIGYDPSTGEELWRVLGTTDLPCPAGIVSGELVVSTTGPNGPIMAVRAGGRGDVTDSHVLWRIPCGGAYVPTGVIDAQLLFLISDGGILRCLDLANGHLIWEKRLHRSYSASLVAGDGKLYVVSEEGDVHVLAVSAECQVLAVNRLGEDCLATPALAQGALFVRTRQHLCCYSSSPALAHDATAGSSDDVLSPVSTQIDQPKPSVAP